MQHSAAAAQASAMIASRGRASAAATATPASTQSAMATGADSGHAHNDCRRGPADRRGDREPKIDPRRALRLGGQIVTKSLRTLEGLVADSGDAEQVLDRTKPPIRLPPIDDAGGHGGPHPGQSF